MGASCSATCRTRGAFLAAWVVAWIVVGFAILPYLTVVPAIWIVRRVEDLSTAEFVAAVLGPPDRAADGPPARVAAVELRSAARDLAAARGLAPVRSRHARADGRQALGPAARGRGDRRHPAPGSRVRGGSPPGRPPHRGRHERDHRRADRRDRRVGLHLRDARHPALRPRRAPAHRRQLGRPAPQPRPARAGDPQPDAEGARAPRSRSSRTTSPRSPRSTPSWSRWPCRAAG